jgi:hypothetical protein
VDARYATLPGSFNGTPSPVISSGTVSCGAWQEIPNGNPVIPPGLVPELVEGVPAQNSPVIGGPNVRQVGSPQQSALNISISAGTVQLTATVQDSQQGQNQSPTLPVTWTSDNSYVATVSSSGLVSFFHKGQAVISLRYSRGVIRTTPTTTPSFTEAQCVYAELILQITN